MANEGSRLGYFGYSEKQALTFLLLHLKKMLFYSLQKFMFSMLAWFRLIFRTLKCVTCIEDTLDIMEKKELVKFQINTLIKTWNTIHNLTERQKCLATKFHLMGTLLSQIIYVKHSWQTKQTTLPTFPIILSQLCYFFFPSDSTMYQFITNSISKMWFYSFLLIFWKVTLPPSCWVSCYRHQFFAYIFLFDLRCLYLLRQAISLTWIVVDSIFNIDFFDMHLIYTHNH